jgi:hypothetical protein
LPRTEQRKPATPAAPAIVRPAGTIEAEGSQVNVSRADDDDDDDDEPKSKPSLADIFFDLF